jgi:hypothetical protein
MSRIGNISNAGGVGYTELTGLGLSSAAQSQVKLDASVSESMSDDILKALAEFRKEGNFNPTTAEMEAKLSVVGVAAKQNEINQAQDLLFGLQQTYQFALQQTGGNASTRTQVWCQLVESPGGTVAANALCDGAPSKVAGKTIAGVFGSAVANYPGGPEALLSSLIPSTFSSSNSLPAGYWGDGHLTPAVMQTMITALQTKIADMKSAVPSSFTDTTGASPLKAHQWLAKEMGVDNPHDSYSLAQWGEIAQKLQVTAAKKSSQLSLGQGGGIQQVNGQYFINGEEMSLSQINFCVRANQYQLIDQQIADQLDAIQRNNAKAKEGQALLDAFKKYDNKDLGLNQSGTLSAGTFFDPLDTNSPLRAFMASQFGSQTFASPDYENYQFVMNGWNANATITSNLNEFFSMIKDVAPDFYASHVTKGDGTAASALYSIRGSISNADYLDLKTAVSTWLQSHSTDNQVAQQLLESLNNTRQAVLDGMSAFTQGQSQVTDRIGGNL